MQVQGDLQAYDDINVTPMLDLAYVLLVIFIIMTTAAVQGVRVELPKTQISASLAKPGTKALTIAANGDVFLDAYPVTMELLETRIDQMKAANPSQPIVVKGDATVHYAKVMAVLELLKRHDITDVGLVTARDKGK